MTLSMLRFAMELVDGRVNKETKCYEEINVEGATKLKQCVKKEHHLTYTAESGKESGEYLTRIIYHWKVLLEVY